MSQEQLVLEELQKGELTSIDALQKFGCFRLSARIHRLKELGHAIQTHMKTLQNNKRIAVYTLTKE